MTTSKWRTCLLLLWTLQLKNKSLHIISLEAERVRRHTLALLGMRFPCLQHLDWRWELRTRVSQVTDQTRTHSSCLLPHRVCTGRKLEPWEGPGFKLWRLGIWCRCPGCAAGLTTRPNACLKLFKIISEYWNLPHAFQWHFIGMLLL